MCVWRNKLLECDSFEGYVTSQLSVIRNRRQAHVRKQEIRNSKVSESQF